MNQQITADASGNGFIALLLFAAVAAWSWLGRGPRCLRWPALVALLIAFPGVGQLLTSYISAFAGPMLMLVILMFATMMMLGGRMGRSRTRQHRRTIRNYDRWYRG